MAIHKSRSRNPDSALKVAGKRAADANLAHIEKMVATGRYGHNVSNRNMIKALELHSHLNTLEDWTRYFTAKHIAHLSAKRKKNPGAKFRAAARRGIFGDTDLDPRDEGEIRYGRARRVRSSGRRRSSKRKDTRASRADMDDLFGAERPVTRTRRSRGETRAERREANRAAWAARHKRTSKAKPRKKSTWRERQQARVDSGFQGYYRRNPRD